MLIPSFAALTLKKGQVTDGASRCTRSWEMAPRTSARFAGGTSLEYRWKIVDWRDGWSTWRKWKPEAKRRQICLGPPIWFRWEYKPLNSRCQQFFVEIQPLKLHLFWDSMLVFWGVFCEDATYALIKLLKQKARVFAKWSVVFSRFLEWKIFFGDTEST